MIEFAKYHGLGNDYLFLDAIRSPEILTCDFSSLSIAMSHRRYGAGSDGIVVLDHSECADFRMRIFNADGSEAQNCGNALRCLGRICHERDYTRLQVFSIETAGGIMTVTLQADDPDYQQIGINMGVPGWEASQIPVNTSGCTLHRTVVTDIRQYDAALVNVGNPHCVLFLDEIEMEMAISEGPVIEKLSIFPERINVGFCSVVNRSAINLIVWERGSGMTGACGTGAAAAFATAHRRGLVDDKCIVIMPGGELKFTMMDDKSIQMQGPAAYAYSGVWPK